METCLTCSSQRVGNDWATDLNWTDTTVLSIFIPIAMVSDEVEILNLDILFKNFI